MRNDEVLQYTEPLADYRWQEDETVLEVAIDISPTFTADDITVVYTDQNVEVRHNETKEGYRVPLPDTGFDTGRYNVNNGVVSVSLERETYEC